MDKNPIIFLMGPTASGKTNLALKISEEFPCELVSVDSVMIYRGLDIGSAKPRDEVLRQYPHHLIDILDPSESYSAANFRVDALRLIREIHSKNKVALLVGGTMLYFSTLQRGLSQMPSANAAVREKISNIANEKGWEFLHTQLKEIDPQAAAKIHPNDPQRIQRALEVYELTGIPISTWHAQPRNPSPPFSALKLALIPRDRRALHKRIEQRFKCMLSEGFLIEAKSLYERDDLNSKLPSMRSVGYRQAWKHFDGEYDLETMCDKAIIATRQLAKRQLTWLRNEVDLSVISAEKYDIHDICHKIHSHLG